ncbi:MAG: electron transfer flavoprotein subunit beta [Spirochaetes bacterium]|nr:MAG: electron transfer flavoprotein subunit beta [Spirochaetota bacterium]
MKIVVLIKQVPETENLAIDEKTGTVIRSGVESIVNPMDLYALEAAFQLKSNSINTTITVITMGPKSAEKSLREALSMGADKAILLSDRQFAGSDTYATSIILSKAVKTLDNFDLILCGEKATDGDTGQVGPEIAIQLGIPIVSFVSHIKTSNSSLIFERITESSFETMQAGFPVAATITKAVGEPRLPTLSGKKTAKLAIIQKLDFNDLNPDSDSIGIKGSPTRVVTITKPSIQRKSQILTPKTEEEIEAAADKLIDFLAEKGLLQRNKKNAQ